VGVSISWTGKLLGFKKKRGQRPKGEKGVFFVFEKGQPSKRKRGDSHKKRRRGKTNGKAFD